MNSPDDVPSPIDLRTMSAARDWAATAMEKRPCREEIFNIIIQTIRTQSIDDPSVLDLGSGPGFFARRLLEAIPSARYAGLDFSPAMHALARERLGPTANRARLLETDFKLPEWSDGLGTFDAIVAIQSVHELRHKGHAPSFYRSARTLLGSSGILLVCDHLVGEGGMDNRELYMTLEEHESALSAGGFEDIRLVLHKSGLVVFRAALGNHV
jgi:SAM-dependent methyltransferase